MAQTKPSRLTMLLRSARQKEQQARQALAAERQRAAVLEAGIDRCRAASARQDAWARQIVGEGGGAGLAFYRQCAAEMRSDVADRSASLAEARSTLDARQTELAECMKQRKAVEQSLRRRQALAAAGAAHREVREADHAHAARAAWEDAENREVEE
jgi:hypothetical protein